MRGFLLGCATALMAGVMAIFFLIIGFAAHAQYAGAGDGATASVGGAAQPRNWGVFYEAYDLLQDEFYGDIPRDGQVGYAAIRGVLSRLGDPNTILVEPEARQREQEQFQGEFGGIGAEVTGNEQGQLVIVAPYEDTPAAEAGLRPNDIILEVDGVVIQGMAIDEAISLIRGPVGTEVTLLIQREGDGEAFEVTLTRATIPDPTVDSVLVEGTDIGYIGLRFFSARTTDEVREAIEALQEQGAERFILDLRNNPGGLLDTALSTSSLFIGDGVIAYQQFNDGTRQPLEAQGNPILPDAPMVVLINEGSASASEILAGALQAYDRATLVGTTSYGKGTVQIPYPLPDGASLHVTVAHWLTPDGIDLSNEGLIPEIVVEPTEEQLQAGEDPAFDRAVEILQETGE